MNFDKKPYILSPSDKQFDQFITNLPSTPNQTKKPYQGWKVSTIVTVAAVAATTVALGVVGYYAYTNGSLNWFGNGQQNQIDQLTQEVNSLKGALQKKTEEVTKSGSVNEARQQKIVKLESEVSSLKTENDQIKTTVSKTIGALQNNEKALKSDVQQRDQAIHQKDQSIIQLKESEANHLSTINSLNIKKDEITRLISNNIYLKEANHNLTYTNQNLDKELQDLQRDNTNFQSRIPLLEGKISFLSTDRYVKPSDFDGLKTENTLLNKRITTLTSNNAGLSKENEKLSNNYNDLNIKLHEMEDRFHTGVDLPPLEPTILESVGSTILNVLSGARTIGAVTGIGSAFIIWSKQPR